MYFYLLAIKTFIIIIIECRTVRKRNKTRIRKHARKLFLSVLTTTTTTTKDTPPPK